jgi:hypothetical protein
VLEPPMMVRIVPWMRKLLVCCGGSQICSEVVEVGWFLTCFADLCCLVLDR